MPTLQTIRERVREHVRETDLRNVTRDVLEYDNAIAEAYLVLSSRLPAPSSVTASAGTIAANADTFTLPTASAEEYGGEVLIRLQSDGTFLMRRTVEEIDRLRSGVTQTTGTSRPTDFCLWEENDQDVQGRCFPRSRELETYDLHRTLIAADLRDAAALDAASVSFSRFGSSALVLHAAAIIASGMTANDLTLRRLNPGVVKQWMRDADTLLYKEHERRNNIESVGRVLRLVR